VHGTETKNKGKLNKKPCTSKETARAKVRGVSTRGRSQEAGLGFVKQVGFKPEVKETVS